MKTVRFSIGEFYGMANCFCHNSLKQCMTIVYDNATRRKLAAVDL